jgi:hypothetical protein
MGTVKIKQTTKTWEGIEHGFCKWNFPSCVGATDGKYVMIQASGHNGSLYFNYKKYYSVVFIALVDTNCKFIAVVVGAYGSSSDIGASVNSMLCSALRNRSLHIPEDKPSPYVNYISCYSR